MSRAVGRRSGSIGVVMAVVVAWLTAVSSSPVAGQVPETARLEAVTELHPERGIAVLDADTRRELALFPDVAGFVRATLLRPLEGSGWVLELVVRREGRELRERRVLDDAALEALRQRISAALDARGLTNVVRREGRGGVVLTSTLLGLGYYGWAVPDALGIDGERGIIAGYLLTSGASFLVPYLATRSRPVSRAALNGTVWGGTRGIVLGTVLGDLLSLDASGDNRSRARNGVGVAGSVLTALAGHAYGGIADHDPARVALAGALGDFALAGAFSTAYALGLYEAEFECFGDLCVSSGSQATRGGHAFGLALGTAGVVLAARHARGAQVSQGDVRVLQSAGLLGAQLVAPFAFAALSDGGYDDERAFAGVLIAGGAAGLWAGHRYGMRAGLTPGDGLLVLAGHLAGGVTAAGLTYLLDDGTNRGATLYLATTAAGSLAGALLTYRAVRGGGPNPARSPDGGLTLEVQPLALLTGASHRAPPPWLTIRF